MEWTRYREWKRIRDGTGAPSAGRERPKNSRVPPAYTWKELPQPQVDFTCGLLNLNPDPSSVST